MSLNASERLATMTPCDLDAANPRVERAQSQSLDDGLLDCHRPGKARRRILLRLAIGALRVREQARLERRCSLEGRGEARHIHDVDTDHPLFLLNAKQAFCPPKPKELDTATSTFRSRGPSVT